MAVEKIDDHVASLARRFLLGHLPAAEAELFATRVVGDDEIFETVKAVESELLDDLVRDRLSPEDRRTVARLQHQPDRLRFAKALDDRTKRRGAPAWSMAWASAIAASLVLLIGAGLLWRASLSSPAATIRASTPRGSKAPSSGAINRPEANVLALAITLGATRDQTRQPDLEIAQEVTAVALSIRIHSADRRASYDVAVSRADGTPVWSGNVTAPANEIKVTIPASLFAPGEYQIDVSGVDSRGTREDLGGQTVTVRGGRSKSR